MKRRSMWATISGAVAAAMLAVAAAPDAAQAQSQAPDPVRETHGDWEVRCADANRCYMMQVRRDDAGRPLLLLRVRKLGEPVTSNGQTYVAEAELFTRLGFFLPAGIIMQVDQGKQERIPFERCLQNGCGSLPLFSQPIVDRLKAGGAANFTMFVQPGRPTGVSISLSGFTAAYNAL